MSKIMYNYPAMMATAESMDGYGGSMRSIGTTIASDQSALAQGWQGDTGMTYQAWQTQWNTALDQLCTSYHAMTSSHRNNTTSMMARDQAEGGKWV